MDRSSIIDTFLAIWSKQRIKFFYLLFSFFFLAEMNYRRINYCNVFVRWLLGKFIIKKFEKSYVLLELRTWFNLR